MFTMRFFLKTRFGQEPGKLILLVDESRQPAEEVEVLYTRQVSVQLNDLWNVGEHLVGFGKVWPHFYMVDQRFSCRGFDEAEEEIDGGSLAGTVLSEQAEDLTAFGSI